MKLIETFLLLSAGFVCSAILLGGTAKFLTAAQKGRTWMFALVPFWMAAWAMASVVVVVRLLSIWGLSFDS